MKNKYWWFETIWHQKMVQALQIAGMGESSQKTYVSTMRQLTGFYNITPSSVKL